MSEDERSPLAWARSSCRDVTNVKWALPQIAFMQLKCLTLQRLVSGNALSYWLGFGQRVHFECTVFI